MEFRKVLILISLLILSVSLRSWADSEEEYVGVSSDAELLEVLEQLPLADMRFAFLTELEPHGLRSSTYWSENMERSFQRGGDRTPELKAQAKLKFLQALKDLSTGVTNPLSLGQEVRVARKLFYNAKHLQTLILAAAGRADVLLSNMAPQNIYYNSLKQALQKFSAACDAGALPPLPSLKRELKLDVKNPIVSRLKERLIFLGYRIRTQDDIFDEDTAAAIRDIQWNLHIKPEGVISPSGKTWKYFTTSCQDRVQQMRADLEKLRWFPQRFESKHIFVNLAFSTFSLIDGPGNFRMNFKIINGRVERKTPTMVDKIVRVVLNPYWVVPPTIFVQDKVEEIKDLYPWEVAAYFESRHYEVWNSNFTERVDPATIDWHRIDENSDVKYFIRQKPHTGNALGVIKFMLTNSFAIYLHDTNQRELFAEPQRQLSSGCVRVERPFELAEYLLRGTSWGMEQIKNAVAKPGEVMSGETKIQLQQGVSVYMVHLTSHLSADGVIRFTDDRYGQNERINLPAW